MSEIFLRFRDLKARGIVNNWPTLKRWVADLGFPSGRYLGPGTRVWLEVRSRGLAQVPADQEHPHREAARSPHRQRGEGSDR